MEDVLSRRKYRAFLFLRCYERRFLHPSLSEYHNETDSESLNTSKS